MSYDEAGWAYGAAAVVVVVAVILVVAVVVNNRVTPQARAADIGGSTYDQQMAALDLAWTRGKAARAKMLQRRIRPTDTRCTTMFRATAASELGNQEFETEAERFFVAGCLARKKLA